MLIKLWLRNLLIRGILSISLLIGVVDRTYSKFSTNFYCIIRGYVYYDGYHVSSLNRDDACILVGQYMEHNAIVLWSTTHWVVIAILDDTEGLYSFRYQWGSDDAYINGKMVPVEWGFVMRG